MRFLPRLFRLSCQTIWQLSCLALLMGASLASQAQTTYRWVDQSGKVHYSDQQPPPSESKNFQRKKLKAGNVIETSGPSYDALQAAKKFPLTLYTSVNCVENCRIARDFLGRRGAAYTEKVIKTLDDAADLKKATGSEQLLVQALQAGNKTGQGFEENAWRNLLDAAGYPPGSGNASPKPPVN